MIHVRFFGLVRLILQDSSIYLSATRLDELLLEITKKYEKLELKDLKKSVIFVNGRNIHHLKMFKTPLKDGDEVQILSPAGGG